MVRRKQKIGNPYPTDCLITLIVRANKKGFVVCDEAPHFLRGPKLKPAWPIRNICIFPFPHPHGRFEDIRGKATFLISMANFCSTKNLKKLHLFLTKVALKSCIYF